MLSGGLREYYELPDGTAAHERFQLAWGHFAGSLSDLLATSRGQSSRSWVVAELPSEVFSVPWDRYAELVDTRGSWSLFARRAAETAYLQKVDREYELLTVDAAEFYRRALDRYPGLEDTFRQYHVVSYLGVTPQHLSRLRAAQRATEATPRTPPGRPAR